LCVGHQPKLVLQNFKPIPKNTKQYMDGDLIT